MRSHVGHRNTTLRTKYKDDVDLIMSKEHVNGGNLWTGEEGSIGKGSPFSTRDVALILVELGFTKKDAIVKDIAGLVFEHQQPDGRFRISRVGAIYPCHTIGCLRVLCYLGYGKHKNLKKTFQYLLSTQENDGGWKCNKFSFGRGPETDHSNPGPTLEALDAFRFIDRSPFKRQLDKAVDFLLWHWEHKKPVGPCLFGIGKLFHQIEYPFLRYNLFYYAFVLSYYEHAVRDRRFKEVYQLLTDKTRDDQIVVENPNRKLSKMDFCSRGRASEAATKRFSEIRINLK